LLTLATVKQMGLIKLYANKQFDCQFIELFRESNGYLSSLINNICYLTY